MGHSRTARERAADDRAAKAHAERHAAVMDPRRRKIGEKIASVLIDQINNSIIRPGPMNEERECYEMADELRAMRSQIVSLVAAIIEVDETGQWSLDGEEIRS